MTSLCPILRYVRHEDVEDRAAEGWVKLADLGWPHDRWSVLMGWWLPGEPEAKKTPYRLPGEPWEAFE